jgi:transposase InsO family protein
MRSQGVGGTLSHCDNNGGRHSVVHFQHFGHFGTPEVIHTDRGTAFHNEVVEELLRMTGVEQSLTTAYSSEENGIVERANQEVLRHLNAILFDSRVHDKWSFEQLPMV